jgi:hypothetical protein
MSELVALPYPLSVLVLNRFSGRGKTSGAELPQIQAKGATLYPRPRQQGDKTRFLYFDRKRALADLGLASEAGSPDS